MATRTERRSAITCLALAKELLEALAVAVVDAAATNNDGAHRWVPRSGA